MARQPCTASQAAASGPTGTLASRARRRASRSACGGGQSRAAAGPRAARRLPKAAGPRAAAASRRGASSLSAPLGSTGCSRASRRRRSRCGRHSAARGDTERSLTSAATLSLQVELGTSAPLYAVHAHLASLARLAAARGAALCLSLPPPAAAAEGRAGGGGVGGVAEEAATAGAGEARRALAQHGLRLEAAVLPGRELDWAREHGASEYGASSEGESHLAAFLEITRDCPRD